MDLKANWVCLGWCYMVLSFYFLFIIIISLMFLRVYGCFVDWIVKLIGWNYATRFNGRYHFKLVDFFSWPLEDLIIWNYYFMGIDNFWILMALLLIQIFGMISWSYMLIVNLSVLVKILNLWLPTQGFWFSVGWVIFILIWLESANFVCLYLRVLSLSVIKFIWTYLYIFWSTRILQMLDHGIFCSCKILLVFCKFDFLSFYNSQIQAN